MTVRGWKVVTRGTKDRAVHDRTPEGRACRVTGKEPTMTERGWEVEPQPGFEPATSLSLWDGRTKNPAPTQWARHGLKRLPCPA